MMTGHLQRYVAFSDETFDPRKMRSAFKFLVLLPAIASADYFMTSYTHKSKVK